MRRDEKFLKHYFRFFAALSVIALIPGGALMVLLITGMWLPLFGAPGFLVLASPTILLYSAALAPLWLSVAAPPRRISQIAAAIFIPLVVAIGPGLLSKKDAADFAARIIKEGISSTALPKPESIELAGDNASGLFVYAQPIGDKDASCNEICRRLLFNGEVAWVRMTRTPDGESRSGKTWSVTYHIEHRDSCPQVFSDGTRIERTVRDRLIAGECLIGEIGGNVAPEVTAKFTTRYSNRHYPVQPLDHGPELATIETVKDLHIESRPDGATKPVVQQTEIVAQTFALPFYFGSEMHMQGGYNGATVGREKTVVNPIDLAQTLRNVFDFKITEISAPPLEDAGKIAERILALPPDTNQVLSAQQQDALNDVLLAIVKQPTLSDDDVDFVRRVIADKRVTEGKLGLVFQNMFRRHTASLEALIPVVLDRISVPLPERTGQYRSMLGWSLANFSANSLRPYRDKIVAVVESRPDWPSNGLLTRLAELGSPEAADLVIRRLDLKSTRQFAAIAACRANDDAWPTLEPAVLAHLKPARRASGLEDDEGPLLLGLVRFGKKSLVADMIEKRGLSNKVGTLNRLSRYEPGFGAEHCRDFL